MKLNIPRSLSLGLCSDVETKYSNKVQWRRGANPTCNANILDATGKLIPQVFGAPRNLRRPRYHEDSRWTRESQNKVGASFIGTLRQITSYPIMSKGFCEACAQWGVKKQLARLPYNIKSGIHAKTQITLKPVSILLKRNTSFWVPYLIKN